MESPRVHALIARVMNVSLVPPEALQLGGDIMYLVDLASEFKSDGILSDSGSLDLSKGTIDRVFVERLTRNPETSPIVPYLAGCFQRALSETRLSTPRKGDTDAEAAHEAGKMICQLCTSYTNMVLQFPDVFPQPPACHESPGKTLYPLLSSRVGSGERMEPEMTLALLELCADDRDVRHGVWASLLNEMCGAARKANLMGDFLGPLSLLSTLLSSKPFMQLVVIELESFKPSPSGPEQGQQFQYYSWLSCFIEYSCILNEAADVCGQLFANADTRTPQELHSNMTAARQSLKTLHDMLHQHVFVPILKAGPEAKARLLGYVSSALAHNADRAKMSYHPRMVCTDAYMLNLSAVCLRLCAPFLDPHSPKLAKLDPNYFLLGKLCPFADDVTRVSADAPRVRELIAEVEASYSASGAPDFHFICEIFFLTLYSLHLGWHATSRQLNQVVRRLQDVRRMRGSMPQGDPRRARVEADVDQFTQYERSIEAHLLDDALLRLISDIYVVVMAFVTRIANPTSANPLASPLPPEPTPIFTCIPEWIFEDVADYYIYLCRYFPHGMKDVSMMDLVTFCIRFMGRDTYLKNPYLRGKFVELVAVYCEWAKQGQGGGGLAAMAVFMEPAVIETLMPSLVTFYVDIEHTGRHDQFYHKFNARHYVGIIIEFLWDRPEHRAALKKTCEDDMSLCVRFVNMMINDLTYMLDEALEALKTIRDTEQLKANVDAWNALSDEERDTKESKLKQAEGMARHQIDFGTATLDMMHRIAAFVPRPFLSPELCPRVASMLNYNLSLLGSSETMKNLNVKNKEKYNWRPKDMIQRICKLYVVFAEHAEFVSQVVADKRSFSTKLMNEAAGILDRIHSDRKLQDGFRGLIEGCVEAEAKEAEDEIPEDEIPDELLDPIMQTLMTDPVKLPSSGTTVDRATITRHLLNEHTDPFNRSELTVDMLQPDEEMAKKVETFLRSRKS